MWNVSPGPLHRSSSSLQEPVLHEASLHLPFEVVMNMQVRSQTAQSYMKDKRSVSPLGIHTCASEPETRKIILTNNRVFARGLLFYFHFSSLLLNTKSSVTRTPVCQRVDLLWQAADFTKHCDGADRDDLLISGRPTLPPEPQPIRFKSKRIYFNVRLKNTALKYTRPTQQR